MGNMGLPMATNLVKNGFTVKGFDLSEATRNKAKEIGITPCTTIAEVSKDVDFIVTSLPRTSDVEKVLMDKGGIFENAKEGTFIADSSTISPIAAKDFAEKAKKLKLRYVDTPMSGGVNGATKGTLTFMVGAENQQDFDHVCKVLDGMGTKKFMCGGPGAGEIAKIANNMILGIHMVAVSEGLALGEKLGIDPKILTEVLSVSTSSCWSLTIQNPRPGVNENSPSSKNYEGGFGTALMKKDMALALDIAEQCKADVKFGEMALEYYNAMDKKGYGGKDFGIVYQYIMKNKKM